MTEVDIEALAQLARLEVSDAERERLEKDIPNILSFVETIQKAQVPETPSLPKHRNVMRDDTDPIEGGMHTEALLKAAPAREGNRITVKQVISRKK
jgi:aspartyl-tRNA(Asn)/glutamyl-tRNA(Gln) amidotransferase subunit C